MPDIFSISVSALQAFQQAITVTSNNVANASTPGYSAESVQLGTATPQQTGSGWIGSGVDVLSVSRAYSQTAVNQLNSSQTALGQANSLQSYTSQVDNLIGTNGGGITSALQAFYGAASTVANDPSSTATRQAFLGQAQTLTQAFNSANSQLASLGANINAGISADVSQINSDAQSIAALNQQIVAATGANPLQPPNTLLDQRDQLINQLSGLTGITTTQNTDGSINVFVGSGQTLVTNTQVSALSTLPNQYNPTQLEVTIAGTGNRPISASLTGGDLGGLLAARTQLIEPIQNQLGQIATALSQSVNTQQNQGLDLTGNLGQNLFSVAAPQVNPSNANTGNASVSAGIANLGALSADNYVLTYAQGAYKLTRVSDGSTVTTSGAGTAASPLTAQGLSLVISGTPANGDQFLIQPTAAAAGTLQVVLTNPSLIAAAGAVRSSSAAANTGSGTISAGTVTDVTNPNLLNTATIAFTSPATYSINGAGNYAYTAGGNIDFNGWQVQISGQPAAHDTFTVQANTGGIGDNRNAQAIAALQNQNVLFNGSASVAGALSAVVTNVGTIAQQANSAQVAQSAINSQAKQSVQSISGVNLDKQAADLLQWQQAYEAAAKALQISSSLFQSVLTAVQSA